MQLEGRVALVTGAGRNIGRAIALSLAREGAAVIVNARSNRDEAEAVAREIEAAGGRASVKLADVGDREALAGMVDASLRDFGHIDILVNNAATRPSAPLLETTYEQWRSVLATNLDATFIASQRVVPGMIERGWGRIITFSGLSAFQGAHEGAHIAASKVGLIGLTRALSMELAPHGILSNCIVPGLIDTRVGELSERLKRRLPNIPVGRQGTTDDIASLCTFLCTDAASFITGQTFHVNGGERTY